MIEAHKNRSSEAMSNPFNNSSGSECRVTEAAFHHVLHVAQFATIALDAALRVEAHEVATDDPVSGQALVAPCAPGDLERAGEDCFLTRGLVASAWKLTNILSRFPSAISSFVGPEPSLHTVRLIVPLSLPSRTVNLNGCDRVEAGERLPGMSEL